MSSPSARGQQQRVAIEPGGAALGLRQRETAGHEIREQQVELAQHHRIGAAARQHQDGAVVAARQRRGPAPRSSPRLPSPRARRGRAECPTPAARCGSCRASSRRHRPRGCSASFQKLKTLAAAPGDQRDVVGPVEDRREGVAIGGETRIAEPRQGRRVLRLDPGERPLAVDLLEPQIGVVVRRFDGRARVGHRVSRARTVMGLN